MKHTRRAILAGSSLMTCIYALGLPGRALLAAGINVLPASIPVSMTTRDGTTLRADLFRPAGDRPTPVLLIRTPYLKSNLLAMSPDALTIAGALAKGMAVLIQDVRGTGESSGEFLPLRFEKDDSADTLAWLEKQSWCNGTINAGGASYLGFTTLACAVAGNPALKACLYFNTSADAYLGWYYSQGGVLSVENTDRYAFFVAAGKLGRGGDDAAGKALLTHATREGPRLADGGTAARALLGSNAPWFAEILDHPLRDAYWKKLSYSEDFARVRACGLHVGGWFDFFSYSTVADCQALSSQAVGEARNHQYLIMGPWTHMSTTAQYEGHDFGPQASAQAFELERRVTAFLADPRGNALPKATYFVMGANEWREAHAFPPPGTRTVAYALDLGAEARTGLITQNNVSSGHRRVAVNAADPVPTRGGRLLSTGDIWSAAGPTDQRPVEARPDVAGFATAPFAVRTDVAGSLKAEIFVSTTMADADVSVTVTDSISGGASRLLCEGIARLSLRDGPDHIAPVEPGKIYRVVVDLGVTANAFLPGHSLRINVSGSNFPDFALNPNYQGSDAGSITVHTGPGMASRLLVPHSPA